MKKILLIGGRGFVGTHLANALAPDNEVYITSRERSQSAIVNAGGERSLRMSTDAALGSLHFLEKMDVVVPLVAKLGHIECMKNPFGSLHGSPVIVLRLLLSLDELSEKPLVVYPSSHTAHKPWTSPYSAHKFLAEGYLDMFWRAYGIPYSVLRFGTFYGPGQRRPSVVNFYVKRALEGKTLPVFRGRENDRLALTYIQDGIRVFKGAIEQKAIEQESYLCAPPVDVVSCCHTLLEIAQAVSDTVGGEVELGAECDSISEAVNPGDSPVRCTLLDWNPTSLLKGIRKTKEWMEHGSR